MGVFHIYMNRENKVTKIIEDDVELDSRVKFRIVFNDWVRDLITIHMWDNGYSETITIKALFEIVFEVVP